MWSTYTWMIVIHGIVAFASAFSIGANDVANAFGTSVGSKTLQLWSAMFLAGIFEFLGAFLLGGSVTSTIAGGIARTATFASTPAVFMYGMLCAETGAATWALFATYMELPISTTHSIVSAVIGFSLVYGGKDAVVWWARNNNFPYIGGIVPVIVSWFASPLLAAFCSYVLYTITRAVVLRRKNSTKMAYWALPAFILLTVFANLYFILTRGLRNVVTIPVTNAAWYTAVASVGAAVVAACVGFPFIAKRLRQFEQEEASDDIKVSFADMKTDEFQARIAAKLAPYEVDPNDKSLSAYYKRFNNMILAGIATDVHKSIEQDQDLMTMHEEAERFKPQTEHVFKYLQVMSACAVAFAHGANEVGNAIGPFNAALYVYQNQKVPGTSVSCPLWIFFFGALGILVGLATYGHNIIRVLGCKVAHISPSRGFCMETATSLVITVATAFSLPLSTTHTITGATGGVGLAEPHKRAVNWRMYGVIFMGWMVTFIAAPGLSALFFALGTGVPSLPQNRDVNFLQNAMLASAANELSALNASNYAAGTFNATLNGTIGSLSSQVGAFQSGSSHYNPAAVNSVVQQVFALFNSTISIKQ